MAAPALADLLQKPGVGGVKSPHLVGWVDGTGGGMSCRVGEVSGSGLLGLAVGGCQLLRIRLILV